MKALFIGGTGTISTAITKQLLEQGCELYLLNRGNRNDTLPEGAHILQADIHDEDQVAKLIEHLDFDVVADFIAFEPAHLERDYRLFGGKPNNSFYQLGFSLSNASIRLSHYGRDAFIQSVLGVFPKQNSMRRLSDEAVSGARLPGDHCKAKPYVR